MSFDKLDPRDYIIVKGAKVNNLKNLNVAVKRNSFTVITGVSGSGKSSLAFDTIYAEGQRQYVESLSSYARQFLGRMEKPAVDYIKGLAPAIAIEQKKASNNPRSTVGTTTEIYDYLKLLFARIGRTISPVSGKEVKKDSVQDVVDYIYGYENGVKIIITCPAIKFSEEDDYLPILLKKGFTRLKRGSEYFFIEDLIDEGKGLPDEVSILVDRVSINKDEEENRFRLADSIETAFYEGNGRCNVEVVGIGERFFSDRFELDGITFEEPSVNFFAFNNPYGACKTCDGFGHILGISESLVFPDPSLSIYQGAIAPWHGEKMSQWLQPLVNHGIEFGFPIHRPYNELDDDHKAILWTGNEYFEGLNDFFSYLESQTHKIQYRVMLSRYRGRTVCPDCKGTRLRKDAHYVKVADKSIQDLVLLPISELIEIFNDLELSAFDKKVADRIVLEIRQRLNFINEVGLGYLTLNRLIGTLSGGEHQRIKLATSIGSALVGSMYILDEPSIGLHPRDTQNLIAVLKNLQEKGNTVIIVEHEEEVMRAADEIIDIGMYAGLNGGSLIDQGTLKSILKTGVGLTAQYLNGKRSIDVPNVQFKGQSFVEILGAKDNNLKSIDVKFPLYGMTCLTGVSGSGKSTLVQNILYPALKRNIEGYGEVPGHFKSLSGKVDKIKHIEFIDQNPIGRSSRSNPVTYIKAYDAIRNFYASLPLATKRGYKPSFFSFNVDGGRCDECQGEGVVKIEMQFMADLYLKCESCGGHRFKEDILEVEYKGKNISDVLEMTVDQAVELFADETRIKEKLYPLQHVGLGYIGLGQSATTLSGGEAQRVKLAYYLSKAASVKEDILFIFDEPSTGLHFHDIKLLIDAFRALIEKGNTVLVIEHNVDIIKCADWIIDLGPEGGEEGGNVVYQGELKGILNEPKSYTGKYLKGRL